MNISSIWFATPLDLDDYALPITCTVLSSVYTMLSTSLYALAGLATWGSGIGTVAQSIITDDTIFYGQSPPVYPSRM